MIVKVLIEISNINVDKTFDYIVPSVLENKIKVGIRVKVPFGNQVLEGFVLETTNKREIDELKGIIDVVDEEPILNEELLNLGKYMSNKYYATLISCYQSMLPKALKAQNKTFINKKVDKYIELNLNDLTNYKFNDKQNKIINILLKEKQVKKDNLNLISNSSVKTLLCKGIIKEVKKERYRLMGGELEKENKKVLTKDQNDVINKIITNKDLPKTFLLHGVTGSGKTLVYLEIVEYMLKLGKNVVFLIPEISLTPQMIEQFRSRFGDDIAILHSRLSEGEKYDEYRKITKGDVHIVIGGCMVI